MTRLGYDKFVWGATIIADIVNYVWRHLYLATIIADISHNHLYLATIIADISHNFIVNFVPNPTFVPHNPTRPFDAMTPRGAGKLGDQLGDDECITAKPSVGRAGKRAAGERPAMRVHGQTYRGQTHPPVHVKLDPDAPVGSDDKDDDEDEDVARVFKDSRGRQYEMISGAEYLQAGVGQDGKPYLAIKTTGSEAVQIHWDGIQLTDAWMRARRNTVFWISQAHWCAANRHGLRLQRLRHLRVMAADDIYDFDSM